MSKLAYAEYLQSDAWAKISNAVRKRARHRCERCKEKPISDVHHLTYARVGRERPEDLVALCRLCHDAKHNIRSAAGNRHEERLVQKLYRYTGGRPSR